jgi:hypothetical protein
MASAREKIPQLGLWDDEVPKLSHDTMVIWAYKNAERLVQQYLTAFPSRDHGNALAKKWVYPAITIRPGELADMTSMPTKPTTLVVKKVVEQVIQQYPENGNGRSLPRILGYADLVISWYDPTIEWGSDQQWHVGGRERQLLVEAKTVLPSLGELMRQLNLYRLAYANVVVVAPDATYAEILNEQGILVVPYNDEKSE